MGKKCFKNELTVRTMHVHHKVVRTYISILCILETSNLFRCIFDVTQSQLMHVLAVSKMPASVDSLSLFVNKAYKLQGFNHLLSTGMMI